MSPSEEARDILTSLGVQSGGTLVSNSPIDGKPIGSAVEASAADVAAACDRAQQAFLQWRTVQPRGGVSW